MSKLLRTALETGKVEFKFLLAVHKPFSITSGRYYVLVNNAVKALHKKRKHQMTQNLIVNLSKASMLKYQALWYSSFIAVYIWFLYWVAYDFFVWQKPIAEVNPINYVGSIAAIVFMWAGTKIWKRNRIKAASPQQKLLPQKPTPQPKPQQPPQKTIPAAPANSTCAHYLGYLNQRPKSQEIPAECLTCEHVIQCMGSTN
jgi:hypothetical protein